MPNTMMTVGGCRLEILTAGETFLGVGKVWIGDTLVRSGRLPWRCMTQSFAGLEVHAGHGLTYTNVAPLAAMEGFCEFNIGHSIISRAIFTGLRSAVAEMKALIR